MCDSLLIQQYHAEAILLSSRNNGTWNKAQECSSKVMDSALTFIGCLNMSFKWGLIALVCCYAPIMYCHITDVINIDAHLFDRRQERQKEIKSWPCFQSKADLFLQLLKCGLFSISATHCFHKLLHVEFGVMYSSDGTFCLTVETKWDRMSSPIIMS